mmetsp:Transcript_2196/g.3786  ORF Transcript_2196/g.3786 Transcript_2196/m.3786 type:complete len:606 (-) Transcript_2196:46-1863(-)|eukprot:CAMPEP_0184688444 /NCGR_PEP_ID=MMETSP0312-20130426/29928_1 /TAXON_ID=31354 /ORGANISM="Compsopogon coeruleus, Strain SAG 36.94" /LENGTH=605 /DNA_ID=CAMNT_0027145629 /DNA_START=197 /DNA_END=2014 /DNA_ORIENTATION=+
MSAMDVDRDGSLFLTEHTGDQDSVPDPQPEAVGSLFVCRQLFEHSVTVPKFMGPVASELDLPRLASFLRQKASIMNSTSTPAVMAGDIADATRAITKWEQVDAWVDHVVDSLIVNAVPGCETISEKTMTSAEPLATPVPLPELLVFLAFHMISKDLCYSSRETADIVWPDEQGAGSGKQSSSPRLNDGNSASPKPGVANFADGRDSPLTPRRRPRDSSQLLQSPTIKATALQDIQRETHVLIEHVTDLLIAVASAYMKISGDPMQVLLRSKHVQHLSFIMSPRDTVVLKPDEQFEDLLWAVVPQWRLNPNAELPLFAVAECLKAAMRSSVMNPTSIWNSCELNELERRTIVRSTTRMRDYRIARCSESFIYLLAPLMRVTIIGCVDCTIFVGAAVSLSLIGCGRVRIIAATCRFRVTNCIDSTFYVLTNRIPYFAGDNRGILMAPYNACYVRLESDARAVGVDLRENKWNQIANPLTFEIKSPRMNSSNHNIALMPPEKFMPFMVPVLGEDATWTNRTVAPSPACVLPGDYSASLNHWTREVDATRSLIKKAQLEYSKRHRTGPVNKDFYGVVIEQFREWLTSSGNMRQIHDLMKLEQDLSPPHQ